MINITLMSTVVIDTAPVERAAEDATRQVLSKSGYAVMVAARRSIAYRKASSPAGSPPSAHTEFLKGRILYAYEEDAQTVVIGPERMEGRIGSAPSVLEYGGTVPRRRNTRRRIRQVGGPGEIQIGLGGGITVRHTLLGDVSVTYVRLRTAAQAARANRLNEQLYGPAFIPAHYQAARPFMGPALAQEAPRLSRLWADSIR